MINLNNACVICENISQANSFFKRLRGLMFTQQLEEGAGLHLYPCKSIHTFFLSYPIDVLYVNDRNIVIAMDESIQPGKIGKRYTDAVSVVELSAGVIKKTQTKAGHVLQFLE